MTKQKSLVIGVGELLWDILPGEKKMGGAPANFAYHVQQLGIESYVISAVGNDDLGNKLLKKMEEAGLNYDVQRTKYPTGTVNVTLDGKGIPQYEICEPVAWDFIDMKSEWEAIAKNASAICYGSLAQRDSVSHNSIRQIVNFVSDKAYKAFDINLRQNFYSKSLIEESLCMCNIFKINEEEMEVVSRMFGIKGTQNEICRKLISDYSLKMLALTCGSEGSYLYTDTRRSFKETPKVKVADTVGAGDSFTAAIIAGLLSGKTLEEIHELAVKLSAFVCTKDGAMPKYSVKDF